ncbi:hypothetical protein [Bradyrhizobium sp. NAS80.1]|uniref:hypothetical protein n=1 Tax=Bradyrhizobium sp. NAS80.1 TaxID=1680159 RepID=UPI0011610F2B|nr:hypothetical protein [Bradyrhizobium sp. NAS80.1]
MIDPRDRNRSLHVERWIPNNDAESWAGCVDMLLPRVGIEHRDRDLVERRRHARLLAIAALRAAGEGDLADSLAA